MGIHEAGNADHACTVDDLRNWRLDQWGDCDDRPFTDMHVARSEVGYGWVHGEHGYAPDEELAASG
jgi:hypothetical protein